TYLHTLLRTPKSTLFPYTTLFRSRLKIKNIAPLVSLNMDSVKQNSITQVTHKAPATANALTSPEAELTRFRNNRNGTKNKNNKPINPKRPRLASSSTY